MQLPNLIKIWLLRFALRRVAPSRIPRSGPEGEAVDCFTIRSELGLDEPVIVLGLSGETVDCLEYEGDRYSKKVDHRLIEILNAPVEFTHFRGLLTVTYTGWWDFLLGQLFRAPYIRAWFHFKSSDFGQYLFNRRELVTKQRIEILRAVLDVQLNTGRPPTSLDVMTRLYSIKWYLHPNYEDHHGRVELYLNALTETGELSKNGTDYWIRGPGIAAIEAYEEQSRRHAESVSTQRRMMWLTAVIALLTVVQAGLIKLPPLLNLTSQTTSNAPHVALPAPTPATTTAPARKQPSEPAAPHHSTRSKRPA